MSTNTTLLGLTKQTGTENQDIDIINGNLDKIEQGAKGKLTLPYGVYRKTDGFGTSYANNTFDNLVGWNSDFAAYPDLGFSSSSLFIGYGSGEFTIPCTGIYQLSASIRWVPAGGASDTTGTRRMSLMHRRGTTTTELRRDARSASGMTANPQNDISHVARLVANDIIYFGVAQSSGGNLSLDAGAGGMNLYCSIACIVRTD